MARTTTAAPTALKAFALPKAEPQPKALAELKAERADLLAKVDEVIAAYTGENRTPTQAEQNDIEISLEKARDLAVQIDAAQSRQDADAQRAVVEGLRIGAPGQHQKPVSAADRRWVDSSGRPVAVYGMGDSFVRAYADRGAGHLSVGNLIRAAVTGDAGFAREEMRFLNAMSGGSNTGGGYLVPLELSANVLDRARAASAVMRGGALTVPMTSDQLTMAALESDATFATHTENATIAESDITFGARNFTARTVATMVRMSRELAADAPNAAALVEAALARALAAEIDRQACNGSGSQEEMGLCEDPAVGETGSVGAIAWEDLHAAVVDVQTSNYQPNGYLVSPTIYGDLTILAAGDGVNSAKGWLTAPPLVAPLSPLVSTNVPNSEIVIGDFSQCAFGLRQGALIEVTTSGHDAFSKHAVLIKVTWRGCFRILQADAFHRLAGITS